MSQWFSDRTVDLPLWMIGQGGVKLRVAAFIDYGKLQQLALTSSSSQISYQVVIRINNELYLQYNFADSYNLHTDPDHANRLTLVEATSNAAVSDLKGSLGWGEQYVYNVDTSSRTFIIKVCSTGEENVGGDVGIIRYASVSIYYIEDDNAATVSAIASQEDYCSMDDTATSTFSDTSPMKAPTLGPSSLEDKEQPITPIKPYLPEVLGDDPTPVTSPTRDDGIFEDINSEANDKMETKVLIPILISSILLVVIMIGLVAVLIARQKRKLLIKTEMNEVTNKTNQSKTSKSLEIPAATTSQKIKQNISKDSTTTSEPKKNRPKSTKPTPEFTESSTRDESLSDDNEPVTDNIVVLSNIDEKILEGYKRRYSKSKDRKRYKGNKKSSSSIEHSCRIIPRPGEIEAVISTSPFPSSIDKASRYNEQNHYYDHTNAIRESRILSHQCIESDSTEKDIARQSTSPSNELIQGEMEEKTSRIQGQKGRIRGDDPDRKPKSSSLQRHKGSKLNHDRVQI
jgi:hypothetical protein